MLPKCQGKDFNILRTKISFKKNWKAFFIVFKGLLLNLIKRHFFEKWVQLKEKSKQQHFY